MMNRSELERLCSGMWGGHGWKSEAAAALDINRKTFSRWIADDSVPEWAAEKIRAIVSISAPPSTSPAEDRDDACAVAIEPELTRLRDMAIAAGWHPAEVATAILSLTIGEIRAGAGDHAARETLRDAAKSF